jgi:hypothetical protein
MPFRYWSDDARVPPGLNRFDLIGHYGKGGKFESYRSDRPVALGSRFGPQNLVASAWALQSLDAHPGLWDKSVDQLRGRDLRVGFREEGKEQPRMVGPVAAIESFELGVAKL